MNDYERRAFSEIRDVAEAHFERAMRQKDEGELTRMGLILDGLATVDPDQETFEEAFERIVRPHLPPPADELDDDMPF